jgi:hypothetical protein
MTPAEFIKAYTDWDSRIGVAIVSLRVAQARLKEYEDAQADLSVAHLADLTPLRDGQAIELAARDGEGYFSWDLPVTPLVIEKVMQSVVPDPDALTIGGTAIDGLADPDERVILITVWASTAAGGGDPLVLQTQPGRQWRYPISSTPAAVAVPQEVMP